jgi:hypothetical protein
MRPGQYGYEIIARITPELLTTRMESVAARLSLLLAWRGGPDAIATAAQTLATNDRRRVFLVLMIHRLRVRDRAQAEHIAKMLPADHPAVMWALGGQPDISDNLLDDLGDPLSVAAVLPYLKAQKA